MRAIVANLDCELEWARKHSPGPHRALPSKVQSAVSEFSRSASVLGTQGDRFFALADLGSSPGAYHDCDQVLVWGQTHSHQGRAAHLDEGAPWTERLWQLVCDPSIAAECNDRAFALGLDVPEELGLSNVQLVSSMDELDTYLAKAPLGPAEAWVAKAPWSASGRERLKRRGRIVEGEQRAFAQRLLQRYGALVVEPWMKRIADFGIAGLVGEAFETSLLFPAHQLHCDAGGVFRGIRIDDVQTRAKLGSDTDALKQAANLVMQALHRRGYRGAFGIDAFHYEHEGETKLRALCEINARITFGHVARAAAETEGLLTYEFLPK